MDLDKVARRVAQVNTFGSIHQHLDLIAGFRMRISSFIVPSTMYTKWSRNSFSLAF